MPVTRIELPRSVQPELARRCADALRRGELVALPTETVYGLAARAADPAAVAKLRAVLALADDEELALHFAEVSGARALGDFSDFRADRLATRYWPGPLTLVVPAMDNPRRDIGLRVPASAFAHAVLAELGEPAVFASIRVEGRAVATLDEALARLDGSVELLFDGGPSPIGTPSCVVRCTGPALEALREGILSRHELMSAAANSILFVCTGNTCRSPMAAAIARSLVAERLHCKPDEVEARGLRFASAGAGTMDGLPASPGSLAAASELGLDLSSHLTTSLRADAARKATQVLCLAQSHLEAVLDLAPDLEGRALLLRKDGGDIGDPYGGSLAIYRRARDEITDAIRTRIAEWIAALPPKARG